MARIHLIGAGVIAQWHASAADQLPGATELHVTDPNSAAVEQFTQRFGRAKVHPSVDAMLAASPGDSDIVIVATPPFAHFELTMKALRSRRHVLCEKPLAMTREQATEMLTCARQHHRLLGCCSCRFSGLAASRHVRELMRSGELGEAYHIRWCNRRRRSRSGVEYQPESRWFLDPAKSGGGVLMDWGPYDFAAITELLSPRTIEVSAAFCASPLTGVDPVGNSSAVEQHVAASLEFEDSAGHRLPVSYERAACTHGEECSCVEVELTKGAIRWDWLGGGKVHVTTDKGGTAHTETSEHPDLPEIHPHSRPLVFFDRQIRGELSPAIVDAQAVFNFSCIRAIYEASRTGQPQTVQL